MKVILEETFGPVKLSIKESDDKLVLLADAEPVETESSCKIDRQSLLLIIKKQIDPKLINLGALDQIAQLINAKKAVLERKIAQGKEPGEGKPGRLELIIKKVSPSVRAADTRFVRELNNVIPGAIIGKIHPPEKGEEGADVYGNPIEAKLGKPVKVMHDKSILLKPSYEEDGYQYLIAQQAGYLVEDRGRLSISKTLEIKSDVDITSGNVNFIADVTIIKDVMKGFDVISDKNIHINGRTHGGSLKSRYGEVKVNEIVVGAQNSTVESAGNFSALMIQNITVKCQGDLIVAKDVRDTRIDCLGRILMPKGHFFGSTASTTFGLEAAVIGSPSGSRTVINARTPEELQKLLEQLREDLTSSKELRSSIMEKIGPLAQTIDAEKIPVIGSGQCLTINKLLAECRNLQEQGNILKLAISRIESILANGVRFRVNYHEKLHKGVVINAENESFIVESDITGPGTVEYHVEEHKFVAGRLKALETFPSTNVQSDKEEYSTKEEAAAPSQ